MIQNPKINQSIFIWQINKQLPENFNNLNLFNCEIHEIEKSGKRLLIISRTKVINRNRKKKQKKRVYTEGF